MSVSPIPEGYHSVTPYLIVDGAAEAIEFYKKAFDAVELLRLDMPGGGIGHAEIRIGNSPIMMADSMPERGFVSPVTLGNTPTAFMVYCEDVDALYAQAIAAGATEEQPVMDQFYGDRTGQLKDPFGHLWTIATHKEDLTPEQLKQRMDEFLQESEDL